MSDLNLDRLFNPESIALIGASASPIKWGFIILLNILKGNYQGTMYPINPKADSILGLKCYEKVTDIPGSVDLAMITTPAKFVSPLIDQCGEKGVQNIIVVSADFSEAGPEGAGMEKEIVAKAKKYGMRLVGPNTMGIFSSATSLHALMPAVMPLHDSVSMFSQSGNVGVQMLDYGQIEGIGFQKFVSSGNQADLNAADYISYFGQDKATKVILGYIEGIDANSDFLPIARKISRKKPIIIIKGARTSVGGKAAVSHSAAIAGSSKVNSAAFRQAGLVETHTSLELIDCAKTFSHYPLPEGNRVGIITRGGGWGVLTADACEEADLVVPPLPDDLIKEMDKILPKYWNRNNPIDLVAAIEYDPFPDCLKMLAEWDGVDAVIALGAGLRSFPFQCSEEVRGPKELMDALASMEAFLKRGLDEADPVLLEIQKLVAQTGKPIISVSIGSDYSHREYTKRYQIVSFPTPERAVRVLGQMYKYRRFLNSPA